MATNLLELFGGAVGDNLAGPGATLLGESPGAVRSAADMFLVAIVGRLAQQGSTLAGAGDILKTLAHPSVDSSAVPNVAGVAGGSPLSDSLLTQGAQLANGLFGDRLGAVTASVASAAGIRRSSASSLLSMAVPMVFGLLKRHVDDQHLDGGGVKELLEGQSANVRGSLDPRVATAAGLATPAPDRYPRPPITTGVAGTSSTRRRILPWAVLAAAVVLALVLWQDWRRAPAPAAVATTPVVTDTTATTSAADVAPPPGTLPAKVYFGIGEDVLGGASGQVVNAAAVAIKTSGSSVAITGYADQTGDAAKNVDLAKHRAQAVRDGLIAAGVSADKIEMRPPASVTGSGSAVEARRVEITSVP